MTATSPDMPASDPQAEPSCPEGRTKGGRLGQWLRTLLHVGLVLVMEMRFVADPRSHEGATGDANTACASHSHAWDLVARAIKWARALQARLAAEAMRPRADDCIAGMAVAEVVGQICADLTAAATLLGKSKALRIIVAVADAARAMLGGTAAAWQVLPVGPAPDGAGAAVLPAARMGLRAPDTG
jgi:hypothetical protein